MANKGIVVGLLRGAGTRFATWFYAMMHLLRHEQVLKSTIHQQKFRELMKTYKRKEAIRGVVEDIENKNFFKAMYVLLRAVYPALRALRYCDSNEPIMMDKIYFLTHRTTEALKKSVDQLNDGALFDDFLADSTLDDDFMMEVGEVFGPEEGNQNGGDGNEVDGDDE